MTVCVNLTTPDSVTAWLRTSGPGDRCVYHRGNLLKDRTYGGVDIDAHQVNHVGKLMWDAHEDGVVTLHQRHIGDGKCEYIAIKRKRKR